jgi:hypothetical protein
MSIENIQTLKSWFRKGKRPTESQFASLIDSLRHRSEAINQSDIAGLAVTIGGINSELTSRVPGFDDDLKSVAFGYAPYNEQGIEPTAPGKGALAFGHLPEAANFSINAIGNGSLVFGSAWSEQGAGYIQALEHGGFAHGAVWRYGSILAEDHGSLAGGSVSYYSEIRAISSGAMAHGYSGYNGAIIAYENGATALGFANNSRITAGGPGSVAIGYGKVDTNGNYSMISAGQQGSFAGGYAAGEYSNISTGGKGAMAWAAVMDYGTVSAGGIGAVAHGFAQSQGVISAAGIGSGVIGWASYGAQLNASAPGSFVFGYAKDDGKIGAYSYGAIAVGYAFIGTIKASGGGALAGGMVYGDGSITAPACGALAFGYANGFNYEEINAMAPGAVQFGPGTNNLSNSVAIGNGLRLLSNNGPGVRDGDVWRSGNFLYVRLGAVNKKISTTV